MTKRTGFRSRIVAATVVLGLVAAACGGDDEESGDSEAPTATTGAGTDAPGTTSGSTDAPGTTTGATTGDTGEPGTTTGGTEPSGDAYAVDASACPAEATTPLADGAPIKIGFSAPLTGPLAGFGLIGGGMQAFFNKVNADGGVDGHPLELVTADDGYDAARTKTNVQEFIQSDQIFASLLQVGTPNVGAVLEDYNNSCTPQAYVGTGFPAWGAPELNPFTVGGILAYNTEANFWIEYIEATQPDATVAVLVYNNDFGKSYQTVLEESDLDIVELTLHEATSTLDNEVTTLLASGPDFIIGATTATFCGALATKARQGGFTGPMLVSSTCFSSQFLGVPEVGEAAANVFGMGYLKDPTDPQWEGDEAVDTYLADIEEFGDGVDPAISSIATGYTFGSLMVDSLTEAAESPDGLTRVSLMNAIWNTNTTLPLAYPGAEFVIDGNTDGYGVEYAEAREFLPETGTFESTGETFDLEGQTGIFTG